MNAIGAPFAREYGGSLATRSFGGVQVSRTYYTRGQTGQQLQIAASPGAAASGRTPRRCNLHTRTRDAGRHRLRRPRPGDRHPQPGHRGGPRRPPATPWCWLPGGYGNVFFRSTLAKNSNATATWRAHLRGALFASPSFIQFHPTALPVNSEWQSKTILMSESLRNDGRIWVPRTAGDDRNPNDIPEDERDYYLERMYPAFGNLSPRDVSSRAARTQIESGHGVGPLKNSVYLDFRDSLARLGPGHDHRALRQPVRDVPRRDRRGPLHRSDADRSRCPLLDGRTVERFRPDDFHPRAFRRRRSRLGLSWRQPLGRQLAAVGVCGRLVHAAVLGAELPRRSAGHPTAGRRRSRRDRHAGRRDAPGSTRCCRSAARRARTGSTAGSAKSSTPGAGCPGRRRGSPMRSWRSTG